MVKYSVIWGSDELICPYCRTEVDPIMNIHSEYSDIKHLCEYCGKTFLSSGKCYPSYYSTPNCELNVEKHNYSNEGFHHCLICGHRKGDPQCLKKYIK